MSWDVKLKHPKTGKLGKVERFWEGGTLPVDGTTETEFNITFNYSKYFNFSLLNTLTAKESIPILSIIVKEYGTERDNNYWKATEGNVGYAANIMLNWAKQYPGYIWEVIA